MFCTHSSLRVASLRSIKIEGDYSRDNQAIYLPTAKCIPLIDTDIIEYLAEGITYEVFTDTIIDVRSEAVIVKYHPKLYTAGCISGPHIIDSDDGEGPVRFRIEMLADLDFNQLPWIVKLYVVKRG
jgi:hypothetical protein